MIEHESLTEPTFKPPKQRSRKLLLLISLAILLALGLGGASLYFAYVTERQLAEAIAQADQTDPGWRMLELEASRRIMPDEQNSAVDLANARAQLPQRWPYWETWTAAQVSAQEEEQLRILSESLSEAQPPFQLDDRQIAALRKELPKVNAALAQVYKIADKPHGRFSIAYSRDFVSTLLPHVQDTRSLANVLSYDVLLKAQDGDMDGAMKSCRCLIQAQRAIGDEPTLISTLVRIAIRRIAVKKLERILSQGQPSEASLAGMQGLLDEELAEPLLLIGVRGERALADGFLESVQKGETSLKQFRAGMNANSARPSVVMEDLHNRLFPGAVKTTRAQLLKFNNEYVELTKLPVEEQRQKLASLRQHIDTLPELARMFATATQKSSDAWHRDIADLRCALVVVAAERYRRAHQRWPARLDDLVPGYLAKVPIDPYDGKPLRLLATRDGLLIYSVGDDGVDNGGDLDKLPLQKGKDRGLHLWDVSKRRQPAKRHDKDANRP